MNLLNLVAEGYSPLFLKTLYHFKMLQNIWFQAYQCMYVYWELLFYILQSMDTYYNMMPSQYNLILCKVVNLAFATIWILRKKICVLFTMNMFRSSPRMYYESCLDWKYKDCYVYLGENILLIILNRNLNKTSKCS